jgi:hypothetical protein
LVVGDGSTIRLDGCRSVAARSNAVLEAEAHLEPRITVIWNGRLTPPMKGASCVAAQFSIGGCYVVCCNRIATTKPVLELSMTTRFFFGSDMPCLGRSNVRVSATVVHGHGVRVGCRRLSGCRLFFHLPHRAISLPRSGHPYPPWNSPSGEKSRTAPKCS